MEKPPLVCPHCHSKATTLLSDHLGTVAWCGECHRAWIPAAWPAPPKPRPERERLRA